MELQPSLTISQKLTLTPAMRQALRCLQLPIPELSELLQEEALSNPLLNAEPPEHTAGEALSAPEIREDSIWRVGGQRDPEEDRTDHEPRVAQEQTFQEYLHKQLGQNRLIDSHLRALCDYLVDCLDSRGYLDCPIPQLAQELGCPLSDLEQALFAVQMLDPPGVGARNLSECLILQLAQGPYFNALTVAIARDGLDLLAAQDYKGLCKKLGAKRGEVDLACRAIRSLNPIPSRGFSSGAPLSLSIPDAAIRCEQGHIIIEVDHHALPKLSINQDYADMLHKSDDPAVQDYIKEQLGRARAMIGNLQGRYDTLTRLLAALTAAQPDYFLHGGDLKPLTMQQLAQGMGVSVSTVSRTVQNKSVLFNGMVVPLRSFFTAPARTDGQVSSQAVKQRIQRFIQAEDPTAPLSDDAVCAALSAAGINISRRTAAKYRTALGIPPASARKARS